jgi:hypothetical protein
MTSFVICVRIKSLRRWSNVIFRVAMNMFLNISDGKTKSDTVILVSDVTGINMR